MNMHNYDLLQIFCSSFRHKHYLSFLVGHLNLAGVKELCNPTEVVLVNPTFRKVPTSNTVGSGYQVHALVGTVAKI